jgi:ABC-type lipoprotein export system ATPase subunit
MLVDLQKVTVRFDKRTVLDRLTMRVAGPAMVALMGPSGSGKSTLLSVIAGSVKPAKGQVTVEAERLEWIFQSAPILARRSALANVSLGALSRGESIESAEDAAVDAMEGLGIASLSRQAGYRLSGGERQRVAIARVLATSPELVLADEPTASLDPRSRELVCNALRVVVDAGGLVLVATHDPYVADRCDSTVRLVNGHAKLE